MGENTGDLFSGCRFANQSGEDDDLPTGECEGVDLRVFDDNHFEFHIWDSCVGLQFIDDGLDEFTCGVSGVESFAHIHGV